MVRLRVSWPFSLSSAPTVGNPCRPLQPESVSHERLCPSGHAGDRGPGLKGLGPGGSVLGSRAVIAAEVEEIVDPVMGGEETLGLAGRLEPLHLPLAPSRRLMGILRSVV